MMKWVGVVLGGLLLFPETGMAKTNPETKEHPKTKMLEFETDLPPSPSAEEVVPLHPFFAAPSTGAELMGKVQELEDRLIKLQKAALHQENGNMTLKSEGGVIIESNKDIEFRTPGVVKINGKTLEPPSKTP